MIQTDKAEHFQRLHSRGAPNVLVLPNAWDAASARIVELAGARAIATTSSGVSWSLGRPDGHGVMRGEMIDVVRRIVSAVSVPVTADIEGGYGSGSPDDVAETVRATIGAGAVGINLEDTDPADATALIEIAAQARRIDAARTAAAAEGVALFINLRTDAYLFHIGEADDRFDETVRRARAYLDAGANGIFIPGVVHAPTISRLVNSIDAPINILAGPGAPSIQELGALGVARVSVGGALARSAMAQVRRAATELFAAGTYDSLSGAIPNSEANELFALS
ncbi:MAG: isocitrate lyase/phosphoenolpyruvate mutase family protein [Gemmatimonadota bacterium]